MKSLLILDCLAGEGAFWSAAAQLPLFPFAPQLNNRIQWLSPARIFSSILARHFSSVGHGRNPLLRRYSLNFCTK